MSNSAPLLGVVKSYDVARGLGIVSSEGKSYRFHCTAIAGGSRVIEAGTSVALVLRPALGGVVEAVGLTPT